MKKIIKIVIISILIILSVTISGCVGNKTNSSTDTGDSDTVEKSTIGTMNEIINELSEDNILQGEEWYKIEVKTL